MFDTSEEHRQKTQEILSRADTVFRTIPNTVCLPGGWDGRDHMHNPPLWNGGTALKSTKSDNMLRLTLTGDVIKKHNERSVDYVPMLVRACIDEARVVRYDVEQNYTSFEDQSKGLEVWRTPYDQSLLVRKIGRDAISYAVMQDIGSFLDDQGLLVLYFDQFTEALNQVEKSVQALPVVMND